MRGEGFQFRDPLGGKPGVFADRVRLAGQGQGQQIFADGGQFIRRFAAGIQAGQTRLAVQAGETVDFPLNVQGLGEVWPVAISTCADARAVKVIQPGQGCTSPGLVAVVFGCQGQAFPGLGNDRFDLH